MKKDNYEIVHEVLRKKQFAGALRLLLDPASGRVRRTFADDLNHAWYLVGDARYHLGDLQGALQAFKRSLHHWSHDAEAMMAIGNCYSELGMPRWSAWYLSKASVLKPKDAAILFNWANALHAQAKKLEANRLYAKAAKHAQGALLAAIERNRKLVRPNRSAK